MQREEDRLLLESIKKLTKLIESIEEPKQCKASPYKVTFVLDWRTIIAIVVGLLAIIDKIWDKL